ncbi:hypothetical protein G6F43_001090 [Rhizopus delemar]|nr:hypothetical protein G6F43_001090 [Rhizopus delemar]
MLRRVDQQTKRTNENEVETKESLITNKTSKKGLGVSDKSLNTPPLLRSDSGLKLFKNTNSQEKKLQVFNDKPSNTTIPAKRTNAEVVSESKKKYASVERTARRREKDIEADYEPEGLDLDFTVFDDHLDESAYESIQDPYEEEFSTQRLFKQIQAASQTVIHPTETTVPSFPDTVEYGPPREQEQPFVPEDPDTIVDMSVFTDFADLDGYELIHLFHEEEEDDFLHLSYSEDLNQLPLLLIDEDALEFSNESLLLSENELELDETQVDDVYNPFIDHTFDFHIMVLADLGRKINSALSDLTKAPVIDEKVLDSLVKQICAALLASDVNVMLVQKLRTNIKKSVNLEELANSANKKRLIEKAVMDELSRLVDPQVEPYKPVKRRTNIFMMVGLQGAGKTTTCTKIASFYQRKGWKVALVCADTFRAGAFDQLKQNATKAKIPYYGSYTETDPVTIAVEGVEKFRAEKFEIIIVDTSGRHKQETELFEEMKQISSSVKPDTTIFVMDGTIGQAAESQAKAFKEAAGFGSIIITKMDGHAKGGGAISAVAATHSPIIFLGVGEHLQDMDRFEPKSFIRKVLGVQDMRDVIEHVQDSINLNDNKKLIKNIEKGQYSLRDMYEQFQQISKMGPLSKIMGAIPGMPAEMLAGAEQEGGKRMKRMMCIMDSMTDEELDGDDKPFKEMKRVIRVARGSGTTVCEVQEIIFQYTKFAEMVKSIGGKNGLMQNMQNMNNMDPRRMNNIAEMAKSFGMNPNQKDLMNAAKQMGNMFGGRGGGGGMPNMAELMKAMKF